MTLILLAILLVAVIVGFAVVYAKLKDDAALGLIKQDLQGINQTITDRLDRSNINMTEAISRQFAASSRLIGEVTRDLTEWRL